ncbi:ThuA domain-containing protein, partial [Singulisphaera rosea]
IASTVEDPALIVAELGKGRVFVDALGHDTAGMLEKAFITTFARGTEWAATGKVTLPPEIGPSQPDKGAVRALVIVGGHDHETAFYSIFEGFKDLDWLAIGASGTTFQKDFRDKYDVVIMYDFTRDLDEVGKKNLREFVESGKGVVVLHHALLNYQKWNWWYQDTVGGSYRLSREGGTPSSSVKDREHIFVTPQPHPITAGVAPFHIVDETYGRMYVSPKITPLLTTDNPNSTSVVGWVGPDPKNKVVAIQLGHGHTAFAHPSYRSLVHNAILWAAGRIK